MSNSEMSTALDIEEDEVAEGRYYPLLTSLRPKSAVAY